LHANSISTMALKTFVKLNSITNLTDARYGSGMYVNLLGFDLDKTSDTYVSPELFNEITGWVSGVEFVGEFTKAASFSPLEVLKDYPAVTWVESSDIEVVKSLLGSEYSLIYNVQLEDLYSLTVETVGLLSGAGILVHVCSDSNDLSDTHIDQLARLSKACKVILGAGINEENVLELVESTGIFGVSLCGGEELKPGLKDLNELADILEKLETEE
jgi:phosphoribosylanthranilate isomerase